MVLRLLSLVINRTLRLLRPEEEWVRRKRAVDRDFDSAHGVETGGVTRLKNLRLQGESWRDGVDHIAVDPTEFKAAIESLDLDFRRFTFIDLGAGKGRALLLVSKYPFRRLIGVEFAIELVETARRNLSSVAPTVELVHADAREFNFPPERTVIFLYNPFGPRVMRAVARRVRSSIESHPRELIIMYLNPFQLDCWTDAGFDIVERGGHFAVLT